MSARDAHPEDDLQTRSSREYLPFYRPWIDDDDVEAVAAAIRSGWITTGPTTKEFESEFASQVGATHAVAINSCTAGLHLGLVAMGVGPGDEVITTPYTFVATVATIVEAGATPVLADVEPDTLNIDPEEIARKSGDRTRCIVPVHIAGHPCEMDTILEAACASGVSVMEDAAHAFPASFRGRTIGSMSRATVFSFYATKNLTTGEGGMVTTEDEELAARMRRLALHGMDKDAWRRYDRSGSWFYEVTELGFKYNLSDIQSALGLSQLRKMERMVRRREAIVRSFDDAFEREPALEIPARRSHVGHAWHLYILRLRPDALRIDRDRFIQEMADRGVGCSVHFIPVHLHPYYRDYFGACPEDYPVAFREYSRALTLPLYPAMSDADVAHVVDACLDVTRTFRR
jgi:dTDP-4-amino-4,6-dideoxygalactose transaminase